MRRPFPGAFSLSLLVYLVCLAPAPLLGQCPEPLGSFYGPSQTIFNLPFEPAPAQLQQLTVGDLNEDGLDDILVTAIENLDYADEGFGIWLLINDGAGGFVESRASLFNDPVSSDFGPSRQQFIEEFNGDGQNDILVSSHGLEMGPPDQWPGERNLLYLSNPDGTFSDASAQIASFVGFSHGTTVGDLEGDLDLDILDAGSFGPLLLNDGSGGLEDVSDRLEPLEVAFSDRILGCWFQFLDATGNGLDELLVLSENLLHNQAGPRIGIDDGSGSFTTVVHDPIPGIQPNNCHQLSLPADLNHDGYEDVILHECDSFQPPCYLRVAISNGDGTFRTPPGLGFPDHPTVDNQTIIWNNGSLGDIDRDGQPDVLVTYTEPTGWKSLVFLNDGSGTFRTLPFGFSGPCNFPEFVIDVDGDGGSDLLNLCAGGSVIAIKKAVTPYGPDITGNDQCNRLVGGSLDNTFEGRGGNDELLGGDGADILRGEEGDDLLAGEGGSDALEGGPGTDIGRFRGPRRDYRLAIAGTSGAVTHRTTLAVDTLTSIETLEFADLTCSGLDTAGDSDADGSPDGCDLCAGSDDTDDADGDGAPDGCDICSAGDDFADVDSDGSPDACDLCSGDQTSGDSDGDGFCDDIDSCAGFDDSQDLDVDGVPDGCDLCPGFPEDDIDEDGTPDYCDVCWGLPAGINIDTDGDYLCDPLDDCPLFPGPGTGAVDADFCLFHDSFELGNTSAWLTSGGSALEVLGGSAVFSGDFALQVTTCSPDDLPITAPPMISGDFEACNSIAASGVEVISPGATFRTGTLISLDDFSVTSGTGFTATIDPVLGSPSAWVQHHMGQLLPEYYAAFYLRLDGLNLAVGDELEHLIGYSPSGHPQFKVVLRKDPILLENRLALLAREDGGAFVEHSSEFVLPAGYNRIEIAWRAGAGDGEFRASINEAPYSGLTGLDNDISLVESARWGVVDGTLLSTTGKMQLDEYLAVHAPGYF